LTATAGTQFISKAFADATCTTSANVLGSNNIWTESNTFNNNIIANSTTITPTVLSYISSLSSNAQTPIKCKGSISISNIYRFVSGITKAMVGLGNVDNTSDINKPISTATQTAFNLKAPLASPTFTGLSPRQW
jgi:hypothetical protein